MHLLPLSLGRLVEHAERTDRGGRYALASVLLHVHPDNTFEAVATDTKVLVRVTGPCVAAPTAFPDFPDFAAKPDGAATALIPADAWRQAFTWARKLTVRQKTEKSPLRCVAVRIGETETTFAAVNEYHQWFESTPNLGGRYLPYQEIIAAAVKAPQHRTEVDPRLFAEILCTATEIADPSWPKVVLEMNDPRKPLAVRCARGDGLEFTGILMPLVSDTASSPPPPTTDAERIAAATTVSSSSGTSGRTSPDIEQIAALNEVYAELERQRVSDAHRIAILEAERDALARQIAELKEALSTARNPSLPGTE